MTARGPRARRRPASFPLRGAAPARPPPGGLNMASRLRPLRVLLPAGVISGCVVASRSPASSRCDDVPEDTVSSRLARDLQAWLMPSDGDGGESLGLMVKDLHEAVSEDIQMSADEGKRLPLNFLMVKAMHDRQLLASKRAAKRTARNGNGIGNPRDGQGRKLSPRDRRILQRSAHYARFAAASYDSFVDTVKELSADEGALPPPDLLSKSTDFIQKWFVGKRTKINPDDIKELVRSSSPETRTYFVAVDHVSRSVIVSIRGTYSFTDTMVDLLCNPVDFAGGKAHQGIAKSALRVWASVQAQVEKQLREHSDYKLVLTGHSLGAGTAILLKVLLNSTQGWKRGSNNDKGGAAGATPAPAPARLDAGRPVRVECYAFAPPPVFSAPGAAWMRDVYSFVNGADCVPTMSLGSLYSLARTLRNVDQLPLDVYKRSEFVLDARVRLQQREQGVGEEDREDSRRKIALDILGLRTHPYLSFLGGGGAESERTEEDMGSTWEEGDEDEDDAPADTGSIWEEDEEEEEEDEEEEEEGRRWQTQSSANPDGEPTKREREEGDGGEDEDEGDDTLAALGAEAFRSTISRVGEEWARFTGDVSEAAESLLDAVNKAGTSAGSLYDSVGRVTEGVRALSPDEVALTALLLKHLAAGGGPSPDQVQLLVQKCERDGTRPQKGTARCSETMTVGDLIIPGNVYLLEGWDAENGGQEDGESRKTGRGAGGDLVTARKTSSAELGGIRLHSSMMADHSMGAYEPAIVAAASRCKKR